ncbi:GAF and ANTAR domain-containing protein [Lentzea cavernae]|uniref:GAF and ANTAR domain-containing protein n=1 Tax=Lentzea cavernae TaxID=2020703 RepID=UPI00174BA155|nr:GAF and ANTAR domain-containing protein [Lentzea cavernae]
MTPQEPDGSPLGEALDEVTRALNSLDEALSRSDDLPALVEIVCHQVVRAVPGADGVSVTLLDHGAPFTASATSDLVVRLDAVEYREDAGPCIDAAKTGELQRAAMDEALERWPVFARACRAEGMHSFLSTPLTVDERHAGAINVYSTRHNGFADLDGSLLGLYTAATELALRSHTRYLRAIELSEQLRTALDSRAVIDQAKGIIMAVHGITADEAFSMLVGQSQRQNRKLRIVAEEFVNGILTQR